MRSPGAALTSMITAPFSRNGTEMSGESTSIPAMSSPTIPAAISAAVTLSGWISSVRSMEVPPVDRFAVARRNTCSPAAGTAPMEVPREARNSSVAASSGRRVSTLLCPLPRRGSRLAASINCRTVCTPSPTTCAGTRSATAATLPSTTSTR
jgi:hypothetical protein